MEKFFTKPQKYNIERKFILFGEYPQTLAEYITKESLTQKPDFQGYYRAISGNDRYAEATAKPYMNGDTLAFNCEYKEGEKYYFKVEPIRWRILKRTGKQALILCDSIIANRRFDASSNDYAKSEIRSWLNEEFYNTAFNEEQKPLIQITEVDNSAVSTGCKSNPFASENTFDKIFLPSFQDVTNPDYGFNPDATIREKVKKRKSSDFALSQGAQMDLFSCGGEHNSCWWLRSAYPDTSYSARYIGFSWRIKDGLLVTSSACGVVPALTISLD